jgi:hypothetical protein
MEFNDMIDPRKTILIITKFENKNIINRWLDV